jgi:hypothetical protein
VWIAILASTGPDAIARVSSTFLSAICYLPIETVDVALNALESPDPRSRSLDDEGRRIRRVDGGCFVVNYDKYRAFLPQEGDRNSPGAVRVRRWREKHKNVTDSPDVTPVTLRNVTSASASSITVLKTSNNCISSRGDENDGREGVTRNVTEQWNGFAEKHGLTKITGIISGSKRASHLAARMADRSFDFQKLLLKISQSPFLLGKTGGGFTATFDWIICPSNYQKIMEGNYIKKERAITDHPRRAETKAEFDARRKKNDADIVARFGVPE